MSVDFSIIVAAFDVDDSRLDRVKALENASVELLICTNESGGFDSGLLNSAISQCTGKFVSIISNVDLIITENWLRQLAAMVSENQLIGGMGYSIVRQHNVELAAATSMLEWKAVALGVRSEVVSKGTSNPIALGEDFLFASIELFHSYPFEAIDVLGGQMIGRYSMRTRLMGNVQLVSTEDPAESTIVEESILQNFSMGYESLFPISDQGVRCWKRNAEALQNYDAGIAMSIVDGLFVGPELQFLQKQKGKIVVSGKDNDVIISDTTVCLDALPNHETIILFGIGAGELVNTLLLETDCEVLIVEPEARLINYLWMRYDWSSHVQAGRLRYVPICNEHPVLHSISLMQTGRFLQTVLDRNVIPTQVIRSGSYHLYNTFYKTLEISLNHFLKMDKISKTWIGKEKMVYDVTIVSPRCAIFVDLAECLHQLGVRTRILNVPDRANQLTEDNMIQLLASLNVDASKLIIYRNRSFIESEDITLAAGLEDRIPGAQLSWWWDIPNVASFIDMQLAGFTRPAMAFANDILPLLPEGSAWLPPAAQNRFCTDDIYTGDIVPGVSFVGQSRISHLRTQLSVISDVMSKIGGQEFSHLSEIFEKYESFQQLYQRILEEKDAIHEVLNLLTIKMPAQVYYLRYILQMAETAAFRIAAIESLCRNNIAMRVFGDNEWVDSGVVPSDCFEGVIERNELREVYERSELNLNLNFMQVSSTVNPKVLDIAACGGRVLTDMRPELDVLYPDKDIRPLAFDGVEGLPELVSEILNATPEKDKLVEIAQRTRSHHSMLNRARWVIDRFSL
ncbi:hypothetical protein A9Q99_09670 [Gammaproteobacteria bacterium 45_16_T64]|nr:hypothetical protein A9Q99_09670 [Gammaproteobacteria bacterium 45_16_T64]